MRAFELWKNVSVQFPLKILESYTEYLTLFDLGTVYVFVSGNMRIMSINRNNLPREQNPDVHGKKTVRQSLTGLRIWPEHTAPQPNEDSP